MSDTPAQQREVMEENPPKAKPSKSSEMPFLDHLEELRWRIIKGLIAVGVGVVIALIFSHFFIDEVLLGPTHKDFFIYNILHISAVNVHLLSRQLPGQFFTFWGTLAVMGAILGAPVFIYQLYAFVEPALENRHKQKTHRLVFVISLLFTLGICFGYFILTPFAVQFFTQFKIADTVQNFFDINEYFSSLAMWVLSCGIIFQLPMASFFLTKIGVLTPAFLIKYRRHAIVVCFFLGAALTPPDPFSQMLVAIPMIGLFEVAILISRVTYRRRQKEIFGQDGNPAMN